jgi:putative oxidoreductase
VNGWLWNAPNGGWEYPAFLVVAAVAHVLIGDGALAVKPLTLPDSPVAAPSPEIG